MGSSQSTAKKVTFERKDGAIEVTQQAFDLMTGKKRTEDKLDEEIKQPPTPAAPAVETKPVTGNANYAALIEVEERFQEKLRTLEATQKRNLATEKEALEGAVKELETKLQSSFIANGGICREAQDVIVQCYRENPGKPLNCSKLIEQFSQCVDNERRRLLGAKAATTKSAPTS